MRVRVGCGLLDGCRAERGARRLRHDCVTPFDAGAFPGAGRTVNYSEGPVPQLDTVQVDSTHGPEFLYGEAQLAKYRSHLDWMERIALPPEKSREFIHDIARHL